MVRYMYPLRLESHGCACRLLLTEEIVQRKMSRQTREKPKTLRKCQLQFRDFQVRFRRETITAKRSTPRKQLTLTHTQHKFIKMLCKTPLKHTAHRFLVDASQLMLGTAVCAVLYDMSMNAPACELPRRYRCNVPE